MGRTQDNSPASQADNSYGYSVNSGNNNLDLDSLQIKTAVVKEVISNPVDFFNKPCKAIIDGKEEITTFLRAVKLGGIGFDVSNREILDLIPRNTILGYSLENGASQSTSSPTFFLPFFSSHFALPVKPGEHVWVVYDSQGNGYWVSRKVSYRQVEDVNYTHEYRERVLEVLQNEYDRITEQSKNRLSIDNPIKRDSEKYNLYSFPDLEGDSSGQIPGIFNRNERINSSLPGQMTFDGLALDSIAYQNEFAGEPVPRHSKNCGDLTIQGSNNTLIHLGTDLTSNVKDKVNEKLGFLSKDASTVAGGLTNPASIKPSQQAGMIDLVVGRFTESMLDTVNKDDGIDSYFYDLQGLLDKDKNVSLPAGNFNVAKNARSKNAKSLEHYETDKGVQYRLGTELSSEGQHSLLSQKHSAARLFLSMKSDPDYLWSGLTDDYGEKSAEEINSAASFSEYGISQKTKEGNEKSAFVAYAERARIFTEDDVKIKNRNAMISFDKEGNIYLKSSGNASIILDSEGNIVLTPGAKGQILVNNYYNIISQSEASDEEIDNVAIVGNGVSLGTSTLDANPVINKKMGLKSFSIEEFIQAGKSVSLIDFSRDVSHKVFKHKMRTEHLPVYHNESFNLKLESDPRALSNNLTPIFQSRNNTEDES